jgi:hypothetical protein
MASAVCWQCVEDVYFKRRVKQEGDRIKCSVCDRTRKGFTLKRLGGVLASVLRKNVHQGEEIPTIGYGDDDSVSYEQQGDDLAYWVQTILGQYFDFNDEIVDAVVGSEFVDVRDGGIPFFDSTANYEEYPPDLRQYHSEWTLALQDLKHSRRFFNSSAQALFEKLFHQIERIESWSKDSGQDESVVWKLPKGSQLYRARVCNSTAKLNEFYTHPFEKVGPPTPEHARTGRMNVEGVSVFYGARDFETCLAEMRPALGGDTAVIELQTTIALRVLDFTKLEKSHGVGLSYFQPDFDAEVDRLAFLRRLHTLISQPVTPGRESDYLITQTMAEYLAHVHHEPFDGILFKSVQREGGINVVLFSKRNSNGTPGNNTFPISYVTGSFKLFATEAINYKHHERRLTEDKGEVRVANDWWD